MELINKCIDYLKANKTMAYILAGIVALIVIVVIALIVKSAKRSKAKKRAKSANAQAVKQANTATKTVTTSTPAVKATAVSDEEKKKARQATLARLEAERLEAEREEAEERAQAEAKAKEEAKATKKVETSEKTKKATEKPAPKTTTPTKSTTKPTTKSTTVKATEKKPSAQTATTEAKTTTATKTVKKVNEKPATVKAEEKKEKQTGKGYSGKWCIFRAVTQGADDEEMYFFELRASNGEKLLSSEEYTSYNGVLKGIETHKANIEKGNFRITLSKKGDYIFKLLSGKNTLLCTGANYPSKMRCESAVESTKRFAKTAVIDETVQDFVLKVPVEDEAEILDLPDGYNGKWIIVGNKDEDGEEVFYFELFANNGEKLLSSEEYTTYIGAVNGIQTHKTNIEKGNFRISLTKRGDYIYKLLNGNGQLLCLGEHYKTKRRCQSAVESVKRFAKNSPVLTDPEHTK